MAFEVAGDSPDPSTQTGAMLVGHDGAPITWACNAPVGADRWLDLTTVPREHKMGLVEHAERAVVLRAARLGLATQGATLYATWYACVECARAIAAAGVVRVVGCRAIYDNTPERWHETVNQGLALLKRSEVACEWIDARPGTAAVRFDGRVISPGGP